MIDSTMNLISESHHKYEKREQRWSQDLELGGQKYKQIYIYIYIYETPNKHSFSISKPSTETNAQNYYFLIYYNVIIYEIGTHYFFFKSLIIYN